MINKLLNILELPLYEKYNYFNLQYAKLKTQLFYRLFFKEIGEKSLIKNPILLQNVSCISLGKNVFIRDHSRLECVLQKNSQKFFPHLIIEDGVSIEQRCHITVALTLKIGRGTTVLSDVVITDIEHSYSDDLLISANNQKLQLSKTRIGNFCYIGSGAKILKGTILGDNVVVGANSVVRGIFPNSCVVAGIPARIVKYTN